MGLVNKALAVYVDWLDSEAESVLPAEKRMILGDLRENLIIITKQLLADKKVQQDIFLTSTREEEVHVAGLVISLANEEFSEDNNNLKEAEKKLKEANTKVASHKEALKNMRKARGHTETSLYTWVEDIIKTCGISKE
jgi:hypothetical protein